MSTKIWTAYKLRRSDQLWSFIRDVKEIATFNVKAVLRDVYSREWSNANALMRKELWDRHAPHYSKPDEQDALQWRVADDYISGEYARSSTSMERSMFDFNVYLSFREFESGIYMIPYGDMAMRDVWKFLEKDKRVRDYHYQNQTDPPRKISARVWRERRRVWNGIDKQGWRNYLQLTICEYEQFYGIKPQGMFELRKGYGTKKGARHG